MFVFVRKGNLAPYKREMIICVEKFKSEQKKKAKQNPEREEPKFRKEVGYRGGGGGEVMREGMVQACVCRET